MALQEQCKEDFISKLIALLLNEGIDALRWFFHENLLQNKNKPLCLKEVIKSNEKLLCQMRDGYHGKVYINNEMYDVITHGNENYFDISIWYVLIRFFCQLKHPNWIWWNEIPEEHQKTPLYNIVKIKRFQEKLKEFVCNAKVDEQRFKLLWNHLTNILDNLNGYKCSLRRLPQYKTSDSMNLTENELFKILEWQTMELEDRDKFYLRDKKTYCNGLKKNCPMKMENFLSSFYQNQKLVKLYFNSPKKRKEKIFGITDKNFLKDISTCSNYFQTGFINEQFEKFHLKIFGDKLKKEDKNSDKQLEKDFINQLVYEIDQSPFLYDIKNETEKNLKENYLKHFREIEIKILSTTEILPMKIINFNLMRVDFEEQFDENNFFCKVGEKTKMTFWWEIFDSKLNNRIILSSSNSAGKSTLLQKVCFSWAKNSCPETRRFDYVIHLDMLAIETKRRNQFTKVCDLITPEIDSKYVEKLEKELNRNCGEKTLILIDNYHRSNKNDDVILEVEDILNGEKWPRASVVMTTNLLSLDTALKQPSNVIINNSAEQKPILSFYNRDFWKIYILIGRDFGDVTGEAGKYRKTNVETDNYMSYLLKSNFQHFNEFGLRKVFKIFDQKVFPHQFDLDDQFQTDVVSHVIAGNYGCFFELSNENSKTLVSMLMNGILVKIGKRFKFSHFIFEDYLASIIVKIKFQNNFESFLQELRMKVEDVFRLKHFLIFLAGSHIKIILENIVRILKNQKKITKTDQIKLNSLIFFFCFQLVCESNSYPEILVPLFSLDDDCASKTLLSEKGKVLHISYAGLISKTTEACLLKIFDEWKVETNRYGLNKLAINQFYICELHIKNCFGIQFPFFGILISKISTLQVVIVTSIKSIHQKELDIFCKHLQLTKTSNLIKLSLRFRSETSNITSFVSLVEACYHKLIYLEELDIDIYNINLFRSLIGKVKERQFTLPLINLNLNSLELQQTDLVDLASCLHFFKFIHKLNLSDTLLIDHFAKLQSTLSLMKNLQVLKLRRCCLSNSSLVAICKVFEHSTTLQGLHVFDLSYNHLFDKRVLRRLINGLKSLKYLQELNLSGNQIGDVLGFDLIKNLQDKIYLEILKLASTEISQSTLAASQHDLKRCSQLKVVDFGGNYFGNMNLEFLNTLHSEIEESQLKEIDLSGINEKYYNELNENEVDKFIKTLPNHKNIEFISLLFTRITRKLNIFNLLIACEKHASLKSIKLSRKCIPLQPKITCWTKLHLI